MSWLCTFCNPPASPPQKKDGGMLEEGEGALAGQPRLVLRLGVGTQACSAMQRQKALGDTQAEGSGCFSFCLAGQPILEKEEF